MEKLSNNKMNRIIKTIQDSTERYIIGNNLKSIVIGVSGGIDSTLVCALLKPVCLKIGVPLIGRFINIESNSEAEKSRASDVGKYFCTDYKEVDLTYEYKVLTNIDNIEGGEYYTDNVTADVLNHKIRMGNIKARMRMIYLYNLAARTGGLVMGTENLTEHYLGFFTLHGDSGTDFEPICDLWKTQVYQICEYLCEHQTTLFEYNTIKNCIEADATDGLGISNTDLDQILPNWKEKYDTTREGYKEVDDILIEYFKNRFTEKSKELSKNPIIRRFEKTSFKRTNPIKIKL